MTDAECVELLQWALPRLRMRWRGFRKVRRQVCKRIRKRMASLEVGSAGDYRRYLEGHRSEWDALDALCRVTISRFFRDRAVFGALRDSVLPALASRALGRGARELRLWSAGCASGEEPYTLAILWRLDLQRRFPGLGCRILATDASARMIERAESARFPPGTLKELPLAWLQQAFDGDGPLRRLKADVRALVELRVQDLRAVMPHGPFDLIACRNLAFTYFDDALQHEILHRLTARLVAGGALVIGAHERLPGDGAGLEAWPQTQGIFRA